MSLTLFSRRPQCFTPQGDPILEPETETETEPTNRERVAMEAKEDIQRENNTHVAPCESKAS